MGSRFTHDNAVMVGIVNRDPHLGSMGAKVKGGGNVKEHEYGRMEGLAIAPHEYGEWREIMGEQVGECDGYRAAAAEFEC